MAAKKASKAKKPAAKKAVKRKAPKAAKAKPKAKPVKAKAKATKKVAKKSAKSKSPRKPASGAAKNLRKPAARKVAKATKPAKIAKPAMVVAKPVKVTKPVKAAKAPAPEIISPHARAIATARKTYVPPVLAQDDDEDGAPRHSLLLGPRNINPYRERKGEQYMGREQLQHFRMILSAWKRDLMLEVDRTVTHMKDEAANPPDPNDRATLESEFALELRTRDRERKLIRKIEEALKRIDDGSYGYCNETGEPIGVKRLEARPVATLCIEAQERRERREKQYGDRDDWYR